MLEKSIKYKRTEAEKKFYDVGHLLKKCPDAKYYIIFNGRQNGKTYSILRHIVEQYYKTGHRAVIIRRFKETFDNLGGRQMFDDLVNNMEITDITHGEWTGVKYYGRAWYLTKEDPDDEDKIIKDKEPFCFAMALNRMETQGKGIAMSNIGTVFLDEFISTTFYLPQEFVLFSNLLSTVIRVSDKVKIFLAGNTVNPYNPYFREMGLTHAAAQEPGTIDIYKYKDTAGKILKVAVERPEESEGKSVSNVYFAFDNPALKMITAGGWQLQNFPHCPIKYKPKDIKYTYFILFDGSCYQCEVVMTHEVDFTYIHRKTTELKHPEKDVIFSTDYHAAANWQRNILKPSGSVYRKIAWYYMASKVFYQDNEVGQAIQNYLAYCKNSATV